MKCNKCGYDDGGSGDMAHVCQRPSYRYGEHPTSFGLVKPEQDKERCVGCEACIDTACGRDECPKGWPKAAQPEQEPVAWITQGGKGWLRWHKSYDDNKDSIPLYKAPPQRKPLTDEQIRVLYKTSTGFNFHGGSALTAFIRAIEAAHGIKE